MLHKVTGGETVLLVMLFPQLAALDIVQVEDLGEDGVRITARAGTEPAACRRCGQVSASCHDRYPAGWPACRAGAGPSRSWSPSAGSAA